MTIFLFLSFILFIIGGVGDLLSTKAALKLPGLTEGNPILKMSPVVLNTVLKCAIVIAVVVLLEFQIFSPTYAGFVFLVPGVIYSVTTWHNIKLIKETSK